MPENVKFNIHCIYSLFEECRPYVLISDVMASIRKEKIEYEMVPQRTHLTEGGGGVVPKTAEYFNEVQPTNIL